ncbi:MAG: hypothetical protein VX346_21105 [Planctomycetota bacterium]|nr:hypothetical protein [Planctomycetota bacterium]
MTLSSRVRWRYVLGAGLLLLIAGGGFYLGTEPRTRSLALSSFRLALGTSALSLPLGASLAIFLVRTDLPGRRLACLVLAGMLLVPLFVQATAWDAGFGRLGWYTVGASLNRPPLHSWLGAVWIHGVAASPWVTLIVGTSLRLIDPELEDQALLDATPLSVLLKITLPRTANAIALAACWIVVTTSGDMTVTDLLGVRTYAEEIYTGFALGSSLGEASLGLGPVAALLACLLGLVLLVTFWVPSPGNWVVLRPARVFLLGRWRWVVGLPAWGVLCVVAGIPLANLCYKAGAIGPGSSADAARDWSVVQFLQVVIETPVKFSSDFVWTVAISGSATLICFLVALPLAWFGRRGGWRSVPALLVAAVTMVIPGPLIGLWSIWCVEWINLQPLFWLYDKTILLPVLCLAVRCVPICLLLTWIHVQAVAQVLIDQAVLEGASRWRIFWHLLVWPSRAGFGVAALVTFAMGMGDLATTILVLPPGVTTVAFRVFDLVHYGVRYELAGLGLTSGLLFFFVGVVVWQLGLWRRVHGSLDATGSIGEQRETT